MYPYPEKLVNKQQLRVALALPAV